MGRREAPGISLGPISHMFAQRLFASMSYPNLLNAFLYSRVEPSLVSHPYTSLDTPLNDTKGIYPLRRSRRGGMAKVEEYLPGVSGISEGCAHFL